MTRRRLYGIVLILKIPRRKWTLLTALIIYQLFLSPHAHPSTDAPIDFLTEHKDKIKKYRERVNTWKHKSYISIYVLGRGKILQALRQDKVYTLDLEKEVQWVLEDINQELRRYKIQMPPLQLVEEAGADISIGTHDDSEYFDQIRRGFYLDDNLRYEALQRFQGITFILDTRNYADGFNSRYDNTQFKRVECLIWHPQLIMNNLNSETILDAEGHPIPIQDEYLKLEQVVRSILKHELLHALGIGHSKARQTANGLWLHGSVMASMTGLHWFHLSEFEINYLKEIWNKDE